MLMEARIHLLKSFFRPIRLTARWEQEMSERRVLLTKEEIYKIYSKTMKKIKMKN